MKKFTLVLLTAFIAVVAWAGLPSDKLVKRGPAQLTNIQAVQTNHMVPTKKVTTMKWQSMPLNYRYAAKANAKANKMAVKPLNRAGVEDLLAMQWMLCSDYYTYDTEAGGMVPSAPTAGGTPVTFTVVDEQTVTINGFTSDATEAITATIEAVTDEKLLAQGILASVSIADGQTLLESDYGPIVLTNISSNSGDPIQAYLVDTGVIVFNSMWAGVIGGEGQYAGYLWTDYCSSMGVPANGTMTWGEGEKAVTHPVFISQESAKNVVVYNFGGEETAVAVNLKEDKTFVIPEQLIHYYSGYGDGNIKLTGVDDGYLATLKGVGTENTLTFDTQWALYFVDGSNLGVYGTINAPATISLLMGELTYPVIADVAATPADPEILKINNYDAAEGYGSIQFVIPTVDTDENDLKESLLYYQLFTDIGGDIQPLIFTTDLYVELTEDMSLIPYAFTDDYDFEDRGTYKVIYLNEDINSKYDRIGVQSIYVGGEETNKSNIVWADVEKPEIVPGADVTFNFNALPEGWPVSNNGNDGDITEDTDIVEGNVTLTVSPSTANTANRYWSTNNGIQLRVYGGTLTFAVPEDEEPITKIVFNHNGKWGANTVDGTEIPNDTDNKIATWTGSAQKVVVTIAGNTQLNSIVVVLGEEEIPDELVELPEGVEAEVWTLEGTYSTSKGSESSQYAVKVAIDGTDIYASGMAYYFPNAFLKGTIDGTTVTFPTGQFVGEDEYGKEYMVGSDDGETLCDIVFSYDVEAKTLTMETKYLLENGDTKDEISYYGYWTDLELYAGEPIVIDPVVAPEELATETYCFKSMAKEYSSDEEDPNEYEPYTCQVEVGFDGDDVYIQGLAQDMPELWVKGTKNADGQYVIPANQFMGNLNIWGYEFPYFWTALDENENLVDAVLDFNAETKTFTTSQTLALNGSKKKLDYYILFQNVEITKMEDVAATPANPIFESINFDSKYPSVYLSIPSKDADGNELLASKMFYTIWIEKDGEQKPYTFTAALYSNDFNEDMTEIPYSYDGEDFYRYGEIVYFEEDVEELKSWTKVGVQSIYYGGNERRVSEVVWMDNAGYQGIASMNADSKKAVIFDMQGRRIAQPAKGLYIRNGKKVVMK